MRSRESLTQLSNAERKTLNCISLKNGESRTLSFLFACSGTLVRVVDGSWRTTGVMFVVVLVVIFIVTALLHPMEISCIYPLMVYFLCIPIGYILIVIYSLCNLHVGEWGTREDIAKKQEEEDYQQVSLRTGACLLMTSYHDRGCEENHCQRFGKNLPFVDFRLRKPKPS